jgi:uncharacterized repeat protein (TIGR03803 family)
MKPKILNLIAAAMALGLAQASFTAQATTLPPRPADSPLTVLYSFTGGADGANPAAGVVIDSQGTLYGATGGGIAYQLAPPAPGGHEWTRTTLYSGLGYMGGSLLLGPDGSLYGANEGSVFRLTRSVTPGQAWTASTLHSFAPDVHDGHLTDGIIAFGDLIIDQAGALYGITTWGGYSMLGTIFKVAPPDADGQPWAESVLYSFENVRGGGAAPNSGLVADANGVLYGVTYKGGIYNCLGGCGVLYKLTPPAPGQTLWTEQILHRFSNTGRDGGFAFSKLFIDQEGALYGTTLQGGGSSNCAGGCGTVFKFSPPLPGKAAWRETILHAFSGSGGDGSMPSEGLTPGRNGVLYGVTYYGGGNRNCNSGCGTLYRLTPPVPGRNVWTETVLYDFRYQGDPASPVGRLVADENGFLYGTSRYGGALGSGSVFVFRPYFPRTAITSTNSGSKFATLPLNVFASPKLIGLSNWFVYGRVAELASSGDLSRSLPDKMASAFPRPTITAREWPQRLGGHWFSTSATRSLPLARRRIGLLAVYGGPLPGGHVGLVEEISLDKRRYRMSQFNRNGRKKYGENWYYFDPADGQPDGALTDSKGRRWYPKFNDPGDPDW